MTTADRREANRKSRELAAHKQRVLPFGDVSDSYTGRDTQLSRRVNNLTAKLERYPNPPRYDPLVAVRGNPADKGTPQPVFIIPRFKSGSLWFTPPVVCRK